MYAWISTARERTHLDVAFGEQFELFRAQIRVVGRAEKPEEVYVLLPRLALVPDVRRRVIVAEDLS